MMEGRSQAKFSPGQLVHHRLFGYRGVVVDVDPVFRGSDRWYDQVALSRPPRDRPWYRVLVHDATCETYVAERNLKRDPTALPVAHPAVGDYFRDFRDGGYVAHRKPN